MNETSKTPGQIAYEEDVRRCPRYPTSGRARAAWNQLDEYERDSWEREPTPRNYPTLSEQSK